MMKTHYHEFRLGDGYIGNIEWTEEGTWFNGTLYVTSEYAPGVVWMDELNAGFGHTEDMIKWSEQYIRENNT